MGRANVKIPYNAWFEDRVLALAFPESWDVRVCDMRGSSAVALSDEGFRHAFANPLGTDRIRDLARGKKEICITFDDMARPTNVGRIAKYVIDELQEAGIKDSSIRFLASLGTHGAHSLMDFRKKLGVEILSRFPVYNHNPYEGCTTLGVTSRGTPVAINTEFMMCDLKIGIGSIVPHITYGFSGGGKIVMPGLASIDGIWHNHAKLGGRGPATKNHPFGKLHPTVGLGKYEDNVLRLDMEEAARLAHLDVKIDAVINYWRETVALFVGDPLAEHREGVKLAKEHYLTDMVTDADIVVANAYSKGNEGHIALAVGAQMLKRAEGGGDLVLIVGAVGGQIPHYLSRSGGKFTGGRLWGRKSHFPPGVKRLIVVCEYPDWAGWEWFGPREGMIWMRSWPEAVKILARDHDAGTQVAVLPDATIQYFS